MSEKGAVHEPLFIVDNSKGGRQGLEYLKDWCQLAASVDIATGYFEIGALLELDGEWQKLDKIRILLGDEVGGRTKAALLAAISNNATKVLDESLTGDKGKNPFLTGTKAIVQAITSGQIECRVYNKDKFHAKAYITHGRMEIIGSRALVGSSNFTRPGLTQNVELNIMQESSSEVAQLQAWFDKHWEDGVDVSESVLATIERHTRPFTPFEIYARSLKELFVGHEENDADWEQHRSVMFPKLDLYQQEAYWAMLGISEKYRGAFLCDGVGLGKTFVGLMLLERLIMRDKKRVVLFAPKAVVDSVWTPEIRKHLDHIGGVSGIADYSSLSVFSHTDLTRIGDFPERFKRITELADAVVIDEAHHFRNRGSLGPLEDEDGWDGTDKRSRYYRLFELIADSPTKELFMLTATPINNSLNDFRNMVELFTRGQDDYFARTIGVNSLSARLNAITRDIRLRHEAEAAEAARRASGEIAAPAQGDTTTVDALAGEESLGSVIAEEEIADNAVEAIEALSADELFKNLVVQRSRAYARQSQIQETGAAAAFPERDDPKVAEYSLKKSYGVLLDMVEKAFRRDRPLFSLAMYYPLAYYTGPDTDVDPFENGRQQQVVGLIRTSFLKRFESSVYAFERSCDRLMRKLMAFVEVHSESASERGAYDAWLGRHEELLAYTSARRLDLFPGTNEDDDDEDIVPPELVIAAELKRLDRSEYDLPTMLDESLEDLEQIAKLLEASKKLTPKKDDKLNALLKLLRGKAVDGNKVLIFTEYADTARYLKKHLIAGGIVGVAEVDSGVAGDRTEILRRFSPYYNGTSSGELAASGKDEITVLITTDVLSEGLNLQDASRMVNYDIHWNPVRLMQRIGRVDRRLNPEVEDLMVGDHPELKKDRGRIRFWNFLPPAELNSILSLYFNVTKKTLLISETLGIEHGLLLTPDDKFGILKEFSHQYEGKISPIEELHLEYQRLLREHPELEGRLAALPAGIFSGRKPTDAGSSGVFLCFRLPALDPTLEEFTLDAGVTKWYLLPAGSEEILDDAAVIAGHIRSEPDTPRQASGRDADLIAVRDKVLKHIKNGYMKRLNVPMSAPDPVLVAWLELTEA